MDVQGRAFLLLLAASGLAMLVVLWPFLYVFALAAVLASVLWPAQRWLSARFGGRRWASALALMSMVAVGVSLPLSWLVGHVVSEGVQGIDQLMTGLTDETPASWRSGLEYTYDLAQEKLFVGMLPPVQEVLSGLMDAVQSTVLDVSRAAPAGVSGFVGALWRLSLDLVVFLVSLYLFFTRGGELLDGLRRVTPLRDQYVSRLYEVFGQLARNIVVGMVGAGLAQGLVAWVGFALAGAPAAVALGTATAITSMVPVVGSMVVWLPVALGLLASGRPGGAAFVAVWSLAATASADNVVKPFLLKNQLQVSPLWMLLALFGGLRSMGVEGLVFGPLLLVLYLTLYTIYLRDFADQNEAVGKT